MDLKNYLSLLLLAAFFTAACGGPSERIRETSVKQPTPAQTPSERLISGVFNVEGAGDSPDQMAAHEARASVNRHERPVVEFDGHLDAS